MSEETKRLLKYDLISAFKDLWIFILIVLGLEAWCYFMYKTVPNIAILTAFVTGIVMMAWGSKDWQTQIRMYVSAGMTRKRIFRVLLTRNTAMFLAAIIIETALVFGCYPGLGRKFLALSAFYQLFIWGFGMITGVMVYRQKKLGTVFMIIGLLLAGTVSAGSILTERQEDFWTALLAEVPTAGMAAVGIMAAAVLAGGIVLAKKQIQIYMVY